MEYKDVDRHLKFRNEKTATQNFGPLHLFIFAQHPTTRDPSCIRQYGYSVRKREDSDEYTVHYGMMVLKKVANGKLVYVESNAKVKQTLLTRNADEMKDLERIRQAVVDLFKGVSGVEFQFIRAL